MTHELKTPIEIAYAANGSLFQFPDPADETRARIKIPERVLRRCLATLRHDPHPRRKNKASQVAEASHGPNTEQHT